MTEKETKAVAEYICNHLTEFQKELFHVNLHKIDVEHLWYVDEDAKEELSNLIDDYCDEFDCPEIKDDIDYDDIFDKVLDMMK